MGDIKQKTQVEFDSMSRDLKETVSKIGVIDSEAARRSIGDSISKIEEAVKSANDTVSTVDGITHDKESELDGARKEFERQIAKINKEIGISVQKINAEMNSHRAKIAESAQHLHEEEALVRKTALDLKSFEKKRVVGSMKLEEVIKDFADRYARMQSMIDKRMDLLSSNMTKIQSKIGEIKAGFGEASDIIDAITAAKKSVESLTEQINNSKSDLAKISSRLEGLANMQKMSVEQRVETIGSLEANIKANGEKVKSIKRGVKGASEQLGRVAKRKSAELPEQKSK
jgi:predicted  nucleic acid-binding Zn-ribbon protein